MHGYGTYTWPDGRKYEGMWRQGKQHGKATMTTKTGEVKTGEYELGKVHFWDDRGEINKHRREMDTLNEVNTELEQNKDNLTQERNSIMVDKNDLGERL